MWYSQFVYLPFKPLTQPLAIVSLQRAEMLDAIFSLPKHIQRNNIVSVCRAGTMLLCFIC